MRFFAFALVLALVGSLSVPAFAQLNPSAASLVIEIDPVQPGPYESFAITVSSVSVDLKNSSLIWKINGSTVLLGTGQTRLTGTTRGLGTSETIDLSVETPTGAMIQDSFAVVPGSVDLLVQANTWTPPFYQGRTVPTPESAINVVAVPTFLGRNGLLNAEKDFIYGWSRGGEPNSAASGVGKQSWVVRNTALAETESIGVTLRSRDGALESTRDVAVPIQKSRVLVEWQSSPGSWKTLVSGSSFPTGTLSLRAYPYFFPAQPGAVAFSWIANGETLRTGLGFDRLNIQLDEAGTLDLSIKGSIEQLFFQDARNDYRVTIQEL